jgi:hypothetical protein
MFESGDTASCFLARVLDGGEWSATYSALNLEKVHAVPIEREYVWVQEPLWTQWRREILLTLLEIEFWTHFIKWKIKSDY